jgi:hypothetical protein
MRSPLSSADPDSKIETMAGWLSADAASASRMNRAIRSPLALDAGSTFNATRRPSCVSRAA